MSNDDRDEQAWLEDFLKSMNYSHMLLGAFIMNTASCLVTLDGEVTFKVSMQKIFSPHPLIPVNTVK